MSIENRLIKREDVDPKEIRAHVQNWRVHPQAQQDAVEGALSEIGWVQSLLVNLRTSTDFPEADRVPTLINGHLRLKIALDDSEATVPVDYVDLDPNEERVVLAALDLTTEMADRDEDMLRALLEEIEVENSALDELFRRILADEEDLPPLNFENDDEDDESFGEFPEYDEETVATEHTCPQCGYQF
jgi:hypothetical protein